MINKNILKNKNLFYIIPFFIVIMILFFVIFSNENSQYYNYFEDIVDSNKTIDMYINDCKDNTSSKESLHKCIYWKSYDLTIEKAIKNKDISICNHLSDSSDCYNKYYFDVSINIWENKCSSITENKLKQRCNYFFDLENAKKNSIKNNRIERCFELAIESKSNNCYDHFYYEKAKKEQDKAYCEKLISKELKEECFSNISDDSYNRTNIISLTGDVIKNNSTWTNLEITEANPIINTAISSSNIKECDKIEDKKISNFCKDQYYLTKSWQEKNKKFCSKIKDKRAKQACLEEYVMNNLKKIYENQSKSPKDFCSVFKTESLRKWCISSTKSYQKKTN